MRKLRYVFYHLKALFKRRSTWVLIASIVFLCLVLSGVNTPDVRNTSLGVVTFESEYADQIVNDINTSDGAYRVYLYQNETELNKDLLSGKIECGFVFSKDFDKKAGRGKTKDLIKYIYSPHTTKGMIAKETVFASFLKVYSEYILQDAYDGIYGEYNEDTMEYLLQKNAEYQDSQNIFTVDFRNDI